MYTNILIPIDGSEASSQALREALKLAKEQGARVCLTHVYEPMKHVVTESAVDLTPAIRRQGEALLNEALEHASNAGVAATTALVAAGGRRIPAAIVEQAVAANADLIAMGTHGRGGIERLILGSVAEGVARRAGIPVLLIHGH